MIVVSVKFKGKGKTYFFDANGLDVPEGTRVVVETSKGMELADCVQGNHEVSEEVLVPPLRPVLRIATQDDLRIAELCKAREKDAFKIAEQKITEHGLDMKLVDVECNFEGNKILFFFTSDGRVDFRELVKDLAGVFRTRIELRQIGVRDEAKMLGGLGICGRPYCCNLFMDDFQPVSTKMAKTQSLSLNPAKISGSCGRLMCCLRYEQEAYEELVKGVPKNGAFVETPVGYGNVAQVNLLRQSVKVRLDGDESTLRSFDADEVAAIPGGRPKPGEPLPHVLTVKPKQKEEPEQEDAWVMPPMFAEDTANEGEEKPTAEKKPGSSSHRRHRGGRGRGHGGSGGNQAQGQKQEQGQAAPKPPAQSGEGGEKKLSGSGSHRSRHRSKKTSGGSGQQQNQQPKPQQPKPAQSGQGQQGGQQPKSGSSSHRRHRGGRGRGHGGSGGQSGGAPKAE